MIRGVREELQRAVLQAPGFIARGAAGLVDGRAPRWMLRRSRAVRDSYVSAVFDRPPTLSEEEAQHGWILRQSDEVRQSFLERVAAKKEEPLSPAAMWMLGQPDEVRHGYADIVIGADAEIPRPQVQWMLRQPTEVRESYIREVIEGGD